MSTSLIQLVNISIVEGNKIWFHPFDFEVKKGEVAAIHCERDLGKRLLKLLIGEESSATGKIRYFGLEHPKNWNEYNRKIGVVIHEEGYYERLSPFEYLQFFRNLYEVDTDVGEYLRKANLLSVKNRKIKLLDASAKRRLSFVKAMIHQPELLIFEEPDQNIDLESKITLRRLITELAEEGIASLVLTSNMESAIILTNQVYRLNEDGMKKIEVLDQSEEITSTTRLQAQVAEQAVNESTTAEKSEAQSFQVQLERIPAKVEEKVILFDPTEIDYIESNDGTVHLHVKGESFPCTITLNQLSGRLQPFGFFRCHRSYIVNLQKVREVMTWTRNSYSLILDDRNKSNIPLSKGKLNDLKEVLGM
ncbi:ABC transporter ATP-binding protein [Alkalihalobacillus alcalophilus ATCC 27647 = CGMCC 1.3604]|uniref:ABC transporter ATP-binding protein n=1 Tax=Alkalihalobacillus alcalophilus ATCC 27647 = CGMCC 1.3604 TaxID=1218173 RepID=J8TEU0_ALKAL|nr:LytTR family transcriptional regulator DNA-binding domain-containing protein [Alkalihalobacillus alcalophilus]AFV25660.1 unknown transporter [Alkalihalobacillus alcalophilus ATCC 27647 = CGMCC 1.3604]KGA98185.1 transcriptional regulator [Alkalihalobacillus alcalophilus ATCC 27647 = CGMCC 1.3604]MED1560819.1 LytTR family transcriptional regulator DNA-binding domain-containing protein [Alkalihalobacillus alcalophilus]THG91207.1 ABC transporter ATP-binding protein [Alkalihalobacillus alcalophil